MNIRIKAKIDHGGKYFPAILTNEHSGSSYGLPMVLIDGEKRARKPGEIFCIRVSDFEMADLARRAGYLALRGISPVDFPRRSSGGKRKKFIGAV